jgi:hypothetical protein
VIPNLAFALPVTVLGAVWLFGIVTLSRGGSKLARRATAGLFVYGAGVIVVGHVLDAANLIPRWISGSEGYGVILPIAFAAISLLVALLTHIVNRVIAGKHRSNETSAREA